MKLLRRVVDDLGCQWYNTYMYTQIYIIAPKRYIIIPIRDKRYSLTCFYLIADGRTHQYIARWPRNDTIVQSLKTEHYSSKDLFTHWITIAESIAWCIKLYKMPALGVVYSHRVCNYWGALMILDANGTILICIHRYISLRQSDT